MTEEQIEAGLVGLERLRGEIDDAVLDVALSALRDRLEALRSGVQPEQRLRQVTVMFVDVVGSTALGGKLDPEDIHLVMDPALERFTSIVERCHGRVLQYAGDSVLAAFGTHGAREDDAQNAVVAGLGIIAEARLLADQVRRQHNHPGFNVRVGLHTGPVLLGGGVDAANTIRGSTVNIAARMEQTAAPGTLRISHDTCRQVQGLFELEEQAPLLVKGVSEPMVTYLVLRSKPRTFRAATRGIEGVQTRMIGRDAELLVLQDAFKRLYSAPGLGAVTVVADAGVGKSRLLYEFEHWVQTWPERFTLVQGRATPQTQGQPFGLLRDLLARHLQIADGDSMAVAKGKVEHGLVPLFVADYGQDMAQSQAHLLGHLIGLDFSDSRHVKGILDDPKQIRSRAFHAAAQLFRRINANDGAPILLQLEDLHWADDGSLEFLNHLIEANRDVALLVLSLTRPTLFERRDDWGAATEIHRRIDLSPLDKSFSHLLAAELLQKLPVVPDALSELLIGRADGNPFYMEELVKMLVDQGAIEVTGERWSLHLEKLMATHVPQTLTGVLQARLDGLPATERLALQQASVIGMVFWEQALAALDAQAPLALPALVRRDLTLARQDASLDDMREYAFRHQTLHQVSYDMLLKRMRRELHAKAAIWLTGLTGARANDFLGATAEHYEKAGDSANACEFFTRAAEQAKKRYAHEAAMGYVERALSLIDGGDGNDTVVLRWRLLDVRERTLDLQGRRTQQRADLEQLQRLADALHDDRRHAELATRHSLLAVRSGDYNGQRRAARHAMALAQRVDDHEMRLNAQRLLADALTRQGDVKSGKAMAQDGLAEARVRCLRGLEGRFLNALTIIAGHQQDLVAMLEASQQATAIRRELGDRRNEAIGLGSIGSGWLELGELDRARVHLEEALKLHRAVGDLALEPIVLANLSQLALWQGDATLSRERAQAALDIAVAVQAVDLEALALWSLGNAELAARNPEAALASFDRAHAVIQTIGSALQHDISVGQVRVALSQENPEGALQALEPLLAHLAAGGTLDGTLGVRLIQLTCYQALERAGDPRAAEVLTNAISELQQQVAAITDPALRQSFLNNVPENREIVAAWAAHQAAAEAAH